MEVNGIRPRAPLAGMALLGYRPFWPDPPRFALHAYEPHPWLTCLIGNRHGSL